MSVQLSVTIITFNEEKNIERCLNSLQNIADEIIVVDSYSTDNTKNICERFNVKFHQQKWLGYSEQKNLANKLSEHDLIFSIDADESVSLELEKSILEVKKNADKNTLFQVNRLTNYCGKWIRHCGWYPDSKIRVWFKQEAQWTGELHEEVISNNEHQIITLKGDLLHYSYYSISQHVSQFNAFTDIGANEGVKKGTHSNILIMITKSWWKFIRDYFIKLGFLDGYYGFVVCVISSFATFIKYAKIRQIQKSK